MVNHHHEKIKKPIIWENTFGTFSKHLDFSKSKLHVSFLHMLLQGAGSPCRRILPVPGDPVRREGGRFMPTFRRRNFWKHFAVPWVCYRLTGFWGGRRQKRDVRSDFWLNKYTQLLHVWNYHLHLGEKWPGKYSPTWERLGFGGRF